MPSGPPLPTVNSMTGMDARDAQLGDPELKKELAATLHARRELGDDYESALVDSFLEKVDQRIDGAVDRRVRRQVAEQQMVVARGSRSPENPPTPGANATASVSSPSSSPSHSPASAAAWPNSPASS